MTTPHHATPHPPPLPRPAPHAQITGPDRDALGEQIQRGYESGTSIRILAANLNRSYGFIHAILQERGVALRQRGGQRRATTIPEQ